MLFSEPMPDSPTPPNGSSQPVTGAGLTAAVKGRRTVDYALEGVHLEVQLWTLKHIARPVDSHVPARPQPVIRGLIAEPV